LARGTGKFFQKTAEKPRLSKKTEKLPPSERKIVTKETHQGCLSFAITGFSELSEVLKNRTQLVKKTFLTS
jgi:hypothetical protein